MNELKLVKKVQEVEDNSFIKVEEPQIVTDYLEVKEKNPAYEYHWCLKNRMSEGRIGNWVVVDKGHPDFKGMRVISDHSPDETYFSYKDLVLCCTRKETAKAIRKVLHDKAQRRTSAATKTYESSIKKISRSLGDREEALSLTKSTDKEE